MTSIQPQYLTLTNLLNARLFRIPEYQRAYSWNRQQRMDLFSDIEKTYLKGDEGSHFMATIVCLRKSKTTLGTDEFYVMEVVDGQQRLTTLIVLLNALKLALNKELPGEAKVERELSELLVKPEGDQLLLLQTNHDSSHYFSNYLRRATAPLPSEAKAIADREILQAIKDCNEFIQRWVKSGRTIVTLAALLKNRLWFLLHEVADEKTVYTVFEVLNSRGLDVAWLDRLKSILMGAVYELKNTDHEELIKELHVAWGDVYKTIGLTQGLSTEALRFAATLQASVAPSRILGEEDAVNRLREKGVTAKSIREVTAWILSVTTACESVVGNPRVAAVTEIAQARILACAIKARTDLGEKDKVALLDTWERVSFRIYGMLRHDARTRVGEYTRLAWRITNEKLAVDQIKSGIAEIGKGFSIDQAVLGLIDSDCYNGWETELRYLLSRYEEHLAKQQGLNFSNEQWEKIWSVSPSDSIEHIWPNSKAPEHLKHRLGNLLLLPPKLNSKLQADEPKDKAQAYLKTGLLIAGAVEEILSGAEWNEAEIIKREKEIVDWAKTEWAD